MDLDFNHVLCFLRKPQAKSTRMPVSAKGPNLKKKTKNKPKKHPNRKLWWQPVIENNLAITRPRFVTARTIQSHYKSLKLWFLCFLFLFTKITHSLSLRPASQHIFHSSQRLNILSLQTLRIKLSFCFKISLIFLWGLFLLRMTLATHDV